MQLKCQSKKPAAQIHDMNQKNFHSNFHTEKNEFYVPFCDTSHERLLNKCATILNLTIIFIQVQRTNALCSTAEENITKVLCILVNCSTLTHRRLCNAQLTLPVL